MTSKILKASRLVGQTLIFRNASVQDAEFILSLRVDANKSRYLSQTSNDLDLQIAWLERYASMSDQAYFIIEDKSGNCMGTVRLYDPVKDSFCWGSWIVKEGAAPVVAIESALMVYTYALNHLDFKAAHFDVRKGNESVWKFHEKFGAARVAETEIDFDYQISNEAIRASLERYRKYLKNDLLVEYLDAN